ncbi:MAG: hypothetical protein AAF532_11890 [Planctomycetota bacterium]
MSRLRLYTGPAEAAGGVATAEQADRPDVIPFATIVRALSPKTDAAEDLGPLARARMLHRNRRCVTCDSPRVSPVSLADGVRDASGQFIPGTATLVGFHCEDCGREWPTDAD